MNKLSKKYLDRIKLLSKKRLISIGTGFRLRRVYVVNMIHSFRQISIFCHLQIILV